MTNTSGEISLKGVSSTATSGVLLKASADKWGTSGSNGGNGGNAILNADTEKLSGDVVADNVSTVALTLTDSSWSGALDTANTAKSSTLALSGSSTWSVSADSFVGTLTGVKVSGTTVTNITGNGHTIFYDASTSTALGGKTYALTGGGTLQPAS